MKLFHLKVSYLVLNDGNCWSVATPSDVWGGTDSKANEAWLTGEVILVEPDTVAESGTSGFDLVPHVVR